jgi:hypothetical protein
VDQRSPRVRPTQQATAPQLQPAELHLSQTAALPLQLPGHHRALEVEVPVGLVASLLYPAALLRMQVPALMQTPLVTMGLASDRS